MSCLYCGNCGDPVPPTDDPNADLDAMVGQILTCPCGRESILSEEDGRNGWFLWLDPLPPPLTFPPGR